MLSNIIRVRRKATWFIYHMKKDHFDMIVDIWIPRGLSYGSPSGNAPRDTNQGQMSNDVKNAIKKKTLKCTLVA